MDKKWQTWVQRARGIHRKIKIGRIRHTCLQGIWSHGHLDLTDIWQCRTPPPPISPWHLWQRKPHMQWKLGNSWCLAHSQFPCPKGCWVHFQEDHHSPVTVSGFPVALWRSFEKDILFGLGRRGRYSLASWPAFRLALSLLWHRHSSDFHYRGLGSITVYSMWNLWWTKWYGCSHCFEHFEFCLLAVIPPMIHTYSLTSMTHMIAL
jgi:hypothetical protein